MAEYIKGNLMSEAGRTIKFGKDTNIVCPVCGKGENPSTLKVRATLETEIEVECPACGYNICMPKEQVDGATDIKGRPIKPIQK